MPIIVRDILEDLAPFAGFAGTCAGNEDKIIKYCDRVSSLLWPRGDWKGTVEYGCIRTCECEFSLPWHLEEVRDAWICNQSLLVRNQYYQSFPGVGIDNCKGGCCFPQIIQTGKYFPYQKVPPEGWRLAVQGTEEGEEKAVVFQMFSHDGQRHSVSIIPTLDVQFLQVTLGELYNVVKPRTKGFVRVFAWSPDCHNLEYVAKYDAHQENPSFSQYRLTGHPWQRGRDRELILRAKKKYVPIRSVDDVLWLDNKVALEFACLAYNAKLAKNNKDYVDNLNLAEEQLEEILENQSPKSWNPIRINYEKQTISPGVTGRLSYGSGRWGSGRRIL